MTGQVTDAELDGEIRPYLLNVERYEKIVESGIFTRQDQVFLWDGKIVEKIREGFPTPPNGDFLEHRMTVDRFLRMVEAGIFTEEDRVFLWKGSLLETMTKGRRHSHSAVKLDHLLVRLLPPTHHCELEQPMRLSDESMPEPDVMVLRGTVDDYDGRIPTPGDVVWVVEVADSSSGFDFGEKLRAYAFVGIPLYWIVDIRERRIVVFSRPTAAVETLSYQDRREYRAEDEIPIILNGVEIGRVAVGEILPRATEAD